MQNATNSMTDSLYQLQSSQNKTDKYLSSPANLVMALLYAVNGSNHKAQKELLGFLGTHKNELTILNNEAVSLQKESTESKVMSIVNTMLVDKKINLSNSYYKFAKRLGKILTMDVKNPQKVVDKVNDLVYNGTHGMIPTILKTSDITNMTSAIVLSTLYIKPQWIKPFEKDDTYKSAFTTLNKKNKQIDFMHKTSFMDYGETDSFQIVSLSCKDQFKVNIFLPKKYYSTRLFDTTFVPPYILRSNKVKLSLPKFKMMSELDIRDNLQMANVKGIFDPDQGLEKAINHTNEKDKLYISKIIHKAIFELDENGVEAAAATAIKMDLCNAIPEKEDITEFNANTSFRYQVIYKNNIVLFDGVYDGQIYETHSSLNREVDVDSDKGKRVYDNNDNDDEYVPRGWDDINNDEMEREIRLKKFDDKQWHKKPVTWVVVGAFVVAMIYYLMKINKAKLNN